MRHREHCTGVHVPMGASVRTIRGAFIVTLSLILALILVSCASANVSSTFRASGTATHELNFSVERSTGDSTDVEDVDRSLSLIEERARAAGLDARRIHSANERGVIVSSTTDSAIDAAGALNALINSIIAVDDAVPVAPFAGQFGQGSPALGGNEYILEMTVDGVVLREAMNDLVSGGVVDIPGNAVIEDVSISYAATMPGEISDSSGVAEDQDTVRWDIPLTNVTEISAVSSVGQETSWLLVTGTTVGAGVVIVLIASLVYRYVAPRSRLASSDTAAAAESTVDHGSETHGKRITHAARRNVWASLHESITRAISGKTVSGTSQSLPDRSPRKEKPDGTDAQGD